MKRFLPLLMLTGLLFGQDVLTTAKGNVYKGKFIERTPNGVVFHAEGMLQSQEIQLSSINRLVLTDGSLIVDFGEFVNKDIKVKIPQENTAGSNTNFSLRNIGGVLIGVSGIMLLFISNDEFEFDESGLADDIDKQYEDWEDRFRSQSNLAYTLLAVGGLLIALDKE